MRPSFLRAVLATAALVASAVSWAQEPTVRRAPEVVPSAGVAAESGPGAFYVNPAALGYDPDPRWMIQAQWDPEDTRRWSGAVTGGLGGLATGFRWFRHGDGATDFALDLGTGLQLPKRVSLGGAMHWHLVSGQRNHVAFDASVAWRPTPWFGMAAVTRNIGDPGGPNRAPPDTSVGLAFRPAGKVVLLGADYVHTFGGVVQPDRFRFTARIRPTSGLFLRAGIDSSLAVGGGIEMYFGGVGGGVHAQSDDLAGMPAMTAWIGTDERDEHLAPPKNQVTHLVLDEAPAYLPERRLFARDDASWHDALAHFARAETSPQIRGMWLTLGQVELSWARWQELHSAIRRLKVAGKPVVVHLTADPGNGALYAASAASRVYVHPAVTVGLVGPGSEGLYLGGFLDSLGIEVQVVRRAEHKSAGEPFTRTGPSEEDVAQREAFLDQVYATLVSGLATGRARTEDDVRAWIDGGPYTAAEAVSIGLVDGRAYEDQVASELQSLHGRKVHLVDLDERPLPHSAWDSPLVVAVVYVEGPLVDGSGLRGPLGAPSAGAETLVAQLRQAAEDPATRAVVIRVDSPGGSVAASDAVWRAVAEVQAAGKPVVVSMGGVAASGGYYLSAGADAIWAEPTTLTGSIGVIAMKPSFGELLDRFGVTTHALTRGRNALLDSPFRAWDPVQRERMQAIVDDAYATFLDRVAVGRGLSPEAVEAVAGGRVFSGAEARDAGLVDQLGGLVEAIADAKARAGLKPRRSVEVVSLRPKPTLLGLLSPNLGRLPFLLGQRRLSAAAFALRSDGLLGPARVDRLAGTALLLAQDGSTVWMIDPWLAELPTR